MSSLRLSVSSPSAWLAVVPTSVIHGKRLSACGRGLSPCLSASSSAFTLGLPHGVVAKLFLVPGVVLERVEVV